jgi:hypothetical protein
MQIVEKGPPDRIVSEDDVGEADHVASGHGADGELIVPGRSEAGRPDLHPLRENVPIEVLIQVRTAIVAPPTIGVQCGNGLRIVFGRRSIAHLADGSDSLTRSVGHDGLLIDPGGGTVPKPAAGPSKGQVPQVTRDERTEAYPLGHPWRSGTDVVVGSCLAR